MSELPSAPSAGPTPIQTAESTRSEASRFHELSEKAIEAVCSIVYGQERPVRLMLTCLLARGHALVEGVPGTAKTLLARTLARTIDARFGRIQFTPDLMPSDILGIHIWDPRTQDFVMREGPIFTDVLLADEINRTPPKTQAALLEVMEERRVTLGGKRHQLSRGFTVFATQNPLEFEGTYPLPEAQLDRFMMKIRVPYPSAEAEADVLRRYSTGVSAHDQVQTEVDPIFSPDDLDSMLRVVGAVHVEEAVVGYVQRLLVASRESEALVLGAGTRSGLHLLLASRAWAALAGRDFVTPDDIKELAVDVMAHRLLLQADAQVDGVTAEDVLRDLLRRVEVPR